LPPLQSHNPPPGSAPGPGLGLGHERKKVTHGASFGFFSLEFRDFTRVVNSSDFEEDNPKLSL
jgi:hypothetical protein